jgi:hypothetical protein
MDDKEKRFVNDLLEASLRKFAGVEPRSGLENRILAGVRARQQDARRRTVWAWAAAMACVVAIVGFVALRGGHRQPAPQPVIAKYPTSNHAPIVATTVPPMNFPRPQRTQHHPQPRAVDWRPQQFPTPRPLSEQEKLLLLYVQALNDSVKPSAPNVQHDPKVELAIPPLSISAIKIDPLDPNEDGDGK